jgi:chromosome segregation protein
VERDTAEGGQVLDPWRAPGYEKALGAALADDLRAPEVGGDEASGWVPLPEYVAPQSLPAGVDSLAEHVTAPPVLARRLAQIGLVEDHEAGAGLQAALLPGQRLVTREGDLWRWDGFRARAEDAPSAAALRLQQLNRLEDLKQQVAHATARAEGATAAHEALRRRLSELTEADRQAREARRAADAARGEASRALSRAEADQTLAQSKLESMGLAVSRHEEEALAARQSLTEAEKARSRTSPICHCAGRGGGREAHRRGGAHDDDVQTLRAG